MITVMGFTKHLKKYTKLLSNNNIPIILSPSYKFSGYALFEFKSKKDDVYFYEFKTTVS